MISLDFSAQATWPSDRPNSLAQTLTACRAPRPLLRSWLRRAVLPSTARTGCSTPVAAAASAAAIQPTAEAGPEGGRLQRHQDAAEDILARDPSGKSSTPHEELFLEGGPPSDGGRAAGAGQDGHHGDDDDADQGMLAIDRGARVLQFPEVPHDFIQRSPPRVRDGASSVVRLRGAIRKMIDKPSAKGNSTKAAEPTGTYRWPWASGKLRVDSNKRAGGHIELFLVGLRARDRLAAMRVIEAAPRMRLTYT